MRESTIMQHVFKGFIGHISMTESIENLIADLIINKSKKSQPLYT